jgi:hypothetical protein
MGVDMRVRLPNNVRVRNVAEVMGAYAGCTPVKSFFRGDSKGGWHASVPGAKVTTTSLPEMAQITIDCPMVDGQTSHFCFYHFEPESDSVFFGGRRLVNGRWGWRFNGSDQNGEHQSRRNGDAQFDPDRWRVGRLGNHDSSTRGRNERRFRGPRFRE